MKKLTIILFVLLLTLGAFSIVLADGREALGVLSGFAKPVSVANAQNETDDAQPEDASSGNGPPTVFNTEIIAPLPLPVTGSVEVPNGIDANVTNFPVTQDVRVTNSDPLNVQIVPAREPVQVGGQSKIIVNEFNNTTSPLTYEVPAGKRFVIEFVSVRAFYLSGTNNPDEQMDGALYLELDGEAHLFTLERFSEVQGTTGIKNQVLSQSLHLYADPGTTVRFHVYREDPTEEVLLNQSISGYLEAVP